MLRGGRRRRLGVEIAAMTRVQFGTFSLEAPQGWTLSSVILAGPVDESPGKGMLTTKAVRAFQRNLITTMERVAEKETPASYVKQQLDGLREAGVSRQEARPPEPVKLASGHEGLLTEQIILGAGGERVRQLQLVVIKDGIAHTSIASHLDGAAFEGAREEFRRLLLSFE
jgi:hypothetical protein